MIKSIKSSLLTMHIEGMRVFLRVDLNVPILDGKVVSDFKLLAIIPTLNLLIAKGARVILATHIDRPHGHDEAQSTKHLVSWFTTRGYTLEWVPTIGDAAVKSQTIQPGSILLLENLRFDNREQQEDIPNRSSRPVRHSRKATAGVIREALCRTDCIEGPQLQHEAAAHDYAQALRKLADFYVNDAFGLLHRLDTSITLLPALFKPEERTIGLLVEREIYELNRLLGHKRFLLILAGGKPKTKLPFVEQLLKSQELLACILLPAVGFPALQAQGIDLGSTQRDKDLIEESKHIIHTAEKNKIPLILPVDFLIGEETNAGNETPHSFKNMMWKTVDAVPANAMVASCGPKTVAACTTVIKKSSAIFLNGISGFLEEPETLQPFKALLQSVAKSDAISIVGGGESVAAAYLYHLEQDITFCSTGGGASLYYLAHKSFPALDYLLS